MQERIKLTSVPCRKHIGSKVPREEKYGDLMTADHKVLNEECESRNCHRFSVVVQDLATRWLQSYPSKSKSSQETEKFSDVSRSSCQAESENSLEFIKAIEDLSWNPCTSMPNRSETKGVAERAVRRATEGTSAVLVQSGLDEK